MEEMLEALKTDREGYEDLVLQQWLNWCGGHGYEMEQMQSLVANTRLYNWWKSGYEKFESEFLEEIRPYASGTTPNDARLLYLKNVLKMQYYSRPLIVSALKTNIQ